ncbi:HAD family hydrolase [Desulfonatronum thioautotrophicum]|uniref:HAD family hydrolase n=1 Tax=Desulfonatronum thioautotrophicum TaxID=617001 RepID=UPI0005EBDBE3|nr:HAD-IA family hydrolase [Desulfonatronum thioautotrophicum]
MSTPRPQGVIFDLDGTLLDTLEDLADAMNTVLASHHWPTHPLDAYRRFVGNGVSMLVRRAVPEVERNDVQRLDAITQEMRSVYGRHWAKKTRLYPGIDPLLRTLKAQGIPMAVLTNKPHDAAMALVDHFFPENMFRLVTGAHPDKPRKPDPTTALETADHLGVLPASTLFLGDSDVDMQTATAAGMTPLGAGWGFRGPDELLASGASMVLNNPMELLDRLPADGPTQSP